MQELNQYLVTKMLDDKVWDIAENYERDLQIEQMAIEMQCLAMDDQSISSNINGTIKSKSKHQMMTNYDKQVGQKPIFTCAVCKMGYVRRMRQRKPMAKRDKMVNGANAFS